MGFRGTKRDVTQRIKTDSILKESEEKFRNLFNLSVDGIIVTDFEGSILDANETAVKSYKINDKTSSKNNFFNLVDSEYQERLNEYFTTIREKNEFGIEAEFKDFSGNFTIVELMGKVSLFREKRRSYMYCVILQKEEKRNIKN
ncbi:MAG: PAS domain S-box protein [Bacteroidales bacterium]|nr:PAS domain S-box protein [Bacteroidales bacterium]